MTQDSSDLWAQCLLLLEQRLRPQTFNTWFRPTRARRLGPDGVVLEVPSSYFAEWLETRYLDVLRQVLRTVTGQAPAVSFVVAQTDAAPPSPLSVDTRADALVASSAPCDSRQTAPLSGEPQTTSLCESAFPSLNARYTFETFVIGEGNRFAHAAALAVAQSPGKTQYNPLVIYGGVGLGKTHLLQAIAHYALRHGCAKRVAFVPSEKFMSDFIESLKTQRTAEFRRLYRSPDILLIDDIQFILKGESTQNEFFHTFNALHQSGRQIVMSCDSPPGRLVGMEERLVSRFQWGLVTPIEPPDLETRIAILHQKAEVSGIQLPNDVAAFVGSYISSNIRELEGALVHLLAYCSVNRVELSVEAARQVIRERMPPEAAGLTVELIQKRVSEHYGVTVEQLLSKTRRQSVANARQVAMYLSKRLTTQSLKAIGLHFGNRDHSTVLHALHSVEAKRMANSAFAQSLATLERDLSLSAS